MADQWKIEKLLLCNIAELGIGEGQTDERYISPVLVFRDNDGGTGSGYVVSPPDLKTVESLAPERNDSFHEAVENGSHRGAGQDVLEVHGFFPFA